MTNPTRIQQLLRAAAFRVESAIPLSLYKRSMRGVTLLRPHLYDEIFNKYGSGNNKNNKHRIYIPFGSSQPVKETTSTPNPQVLKFLEEKGYTIDNYALGLAIMPDGKRTIKIGKVLSKEPELKKLFDNDPSRKAARQVHDGALMVVISRHPYDVLGISFDRGWTSCTNLKGGSNANALKRSIKYGLLAAYLIKDDDRNINRPIARILIRPYFSKDESEVILSSDSMEYGSAPIGFRKTVEQFIDWANSSSPPGIYHAPYDMYLDQEPESIPHGKLDLKQALKVGLDRIKDVETLRELWEKYPRKVSNVDFLFNPYLPSDIADTLAEKFFKREGTLVDADLSGRAYMPNISADLAKRLLHKFDPEEPDLITIVLRGILPAEYMLEHVPRTSDYESFWTEFVGNTRPSKDVVRDLLRKGALDIRSLDNGSKRPYYRSNLIGGYEDLVSPEAILSLLYDPEAKLEQSFVSYLLRNPRAYGLSRKQVEEFRKWKEGLKHTEVTK